MRYSNGIFKTSWLFLSLFLSFGSTHAATGKPYERVMLVPGGEFRLPAGLGMVAAAIDNKWTPDLIIWSCGYALDGALLNWFAHLYGTNTDPKVWRDFFHSKVFHDMMKAVLINHEIFTEKNPAGFTRAHQLFAEAKATQKMQSWLTQKPVSVRPKIFKGPKESLIDVAFNLAPDGVDRPFSLKGIRNLFVTTKVLYSKEMEGQARASDEKLYQETIYADDFTGAALKKMGDAVLKSAIAQEFPKVPMLPDVDVRTGYHAFEAARASLSEPYLTPIMKIKNRENLGVEDASIAGALNISAIELALALGEEVMSVQMRPAPEGSMEDLFFTNTFGYHLDDRRAYIAKNFRETKKVKYWVNLDDTPALEARSGYSPKRVGEGFETVLESKIPDDQATFNKMGDEQWEWGYNAVVKAFNDAR